MRILIAFKNHLSPFIPDTYEDDDIRDFLATEARIEYYEQVRKSKTQYMVHTITFKDHEARTINTEDHETSRDDTDTLTTYSKETFHNEEDEDPSKDDMKNVKNKMSTKRTIKTSQKIVAVKKLRNP